MRTQARITLLSPPSFSLPLSPSLILFGSIQTRHSPNQQPFTRKFSSTLHSTNKYPSSLHSTTQFTCSIQSTTKYQPTLHSTINHSTFLTQNRRSNHTSFSSSPYITNSRTVTSTKNAKNIHLHPLFHKSSSFSPSPSSPYSIQTRKISSSPSDAIVVELATGSVVNTAGDPVLLITGPVSLFEVGLSAVHSVSGLPWWAIIVGFTLILRTALTPLAYKQRVNMVHTINVYPEMSQMSKERKIARIKGDQKKADLLYQEMLALTNKYNVNPLKNFMVLAVQVPILICFFFALSDMAATFPSFATGGFFESSLSAKPTWWAPIVSFLPGILVNEMSSPVAKLQIILKWAIRGLYLVAIPFSYLLPSAIMYYWIPSNLFSVIQTYILNDPEISKKIGIPDVNTTQRIKK